MKHYLITAIISVCILSGCSGNNICKKNDTELLNLSGNVRNMIIYTELDNPAQNIFISDGCSVISFDKDGNLTNFDDKQFIRSEKIDSLIIIPPHKSTFPYPASILLTRKYNENSIEVIGEICNDGQNLKNSCSTKFNFDNKDRLVSIEDNELLSNIFIQKNNCKVISISYEYENADSKLPRKSIFKYKLSGIKHNKTIIFNYKKYDNKGNWILREAFNPENNKRIYTETRHFDYFQ